MEIISINIRRREVKNDLCVSVHTTQGEYVVVGDSVYVNVGEELPNMLVDGGPVAIKQGRWTPMERALIHSHKSTNHGNLAHVDCPLCKEEGRVPE